MTQDRLKEIRSLLDALPEGEWFEKEAAMPRGLTNDDRFDIYAIVGGKEVQVCHMHSANSSANGMTLGWMKMNPKFQAVRRWHLEGLSITKELLSEVETMNGSK